MHEQLAETVQALNRSTELSLHADPAAARSGGAGGAAASTGGAAGEADAASNSSSSSSSSSSQLGAVLKILNIHHHSLTWVDNAARDLSAGIESVRASVLSVADQHALRQGSRLHEYGGGAYAPQTM
jgi:hypothetical protein